MRTLRSVSSALLKAFTDEAINGIFAFAPLVDGMELYVSESRNLWEKSDSVRLQKN